MPASRILLGTPCYEGKVTTQFHRSVLGLVEAFAGSEVSFRHALPEATTIHASRNFLASRALNDETISHLLFVDADTGFKPTWSNECLRSTHQWWGGLHAALAAGWGVETQPCQSTTETNASL